MIILFQVVNLYDSSLTHVFSYKYILQLMINEIAQF